MPYIDPGAAAGGAFEDEMMARAQARRQGAQDALAQRKQDLAEKMQLEEAKMRREEMDARRADLLERAGERDRTDFEKRLLQMLPGDIPDADMQAKAKKYGFETAFKTQPPAPAPLPGGVTMPGTGQPPGPPMVPPPPQSIAAPGPVAFIGNRQDREAAAKLTRIKEIEAVLAASKPDSPEFKKAVLDYEMESGKSIPANLLSPPKAASDKMEVVMRQNPSKPDALPQRLVDGKFIEWGQDVPAGAHWISQPAPKDNTAHELAASKFTQDAHERAMKDIEGWQKPYQANSVQISKALTLLNQKSDEADKIIAPLIISSIVGGSGSGLRMTQNEINRVSGSAWDRMKDRLSQWNPNKDQVRNLTPSEQKDLRAILVAIGKETQSQLKKAQKGRADIDDLAVKGDVAGINKTRTKLETELSGMLDDLLTDPEPEKNKSKTAPGSAAQIAKQIRDQANKK